MTPSARPADTWGCGTSDLICDGRAALVPVQAPVHDVVLMLTRKARRARSIVNQAQLSASIRASLRPGLQLVTVEDPVDSAAARKAIAALAARAVVMLAAHGGALVNLVFLDPAVSSVVELNQPMTSPRCVVTAKTVAMLTVLTSIVVITHFLIVL